MVINFGAGPAKLPKDVLLQVQKDLLNHGNSQMSVMEMSHRSAEYAKIHTDTIQCVYDLLALPSNYKVLLLQGGGTGMFAAICMNLMGRTGKADYIVTGSWSAKAAKEAELYGKVNRVISNPDKLTKYTTIPDKKTWNLDPDASYIYYCDNETVEGIEFNSIPKNGDVPIVADMSSNIFSRPFDITQFGLIYGGAQKNIGSAGVTLVIVREDLVGHAMDTTPSIFNFKTVLKENSIYNTPPTFMIYVMGVVFEWIKKCGGIDKMYENSIKKSQLIYGAIENSKGFYKCPIDQLYRSRMNVPFRIVSNNEKDKKSTDLEKEFLKGAEAKGMVQLKGHRSVGGIRASLYNAVTIEDATVLAKYMEEFYKKYNN